MSPPVEQVASSTVREFLASSASGCPIKQMTQFACVLDLVGKIKCDTFVRTFVAFSLHFDQLMVRCPLEKGEALIEVTKRRKDKFRKM
jgi:hypothetical protein